MPEQVRVAKLIDQGVVFLFVFVVIFAELITTVSYHLVVGAFSTKS